MFWLSLDLPPPLPIVPIQAQIKEADANKDEIMKKCASGEYEYLLIEVGKSKIRVECDKQAPKIRGDGSVVGEDRNELAKPVEIDPDPPPKGCTKEEQLFGLCNLTELRKFTRQKMNDNLAKNPPPPKKRKSPKMSKSKKSKRSPA